MRGRLESVEQRWDDMNSASHTDFARLLGRGKKRMREVEILKSCRPIQITMCIDDSADG